MASDLTDDELREVAPCPACSGRGGKCGVCGARNATLMSAPGVKFSGTGVFYGLNRAALAELKRQWQAEVFDSLAPRHPWTVGDMREGERCVVYGDANGDAEWLVVEHRGSCQDVVCSLVGDPAVKRSFWHGSIVKPVNPYAKGGEQ